MARRHYDPDAPKADFAHAKWHDWWRCKTCGAVVEDWAAHRLWHAELHAGDEPEADSYDLETAAARARAEGHAEARAVDWVGGLRQVVAMVAGDWAAARRLVAHRRHPAADPVAELQPAQRAAIDQARVAVWDRMGPLIERTTGGS